MRVGVEVGGTFTDLVAIEDDRVYITKVPSTPEAPDIGAFNALLAGDIPIANISDLAHGSTIATNAVLERKGFKTALVTTGGFRDIMLMQRHHRLRIYDLEYEKPRPVVERCDTFEVGERIDAEGNVIIGLDEQAIHQGLLPAIADGGYATVALCLLNAYANPGHERRLAAILRVAFPNIFVAMSHEINREFREFERASTTTLSAYVQPVIDHYLSGFSTRLADAGFVGRFSVMQSNGGRIPAEGMGKNAITALLSGPAAGVIGGARQAGLSGFDNLITLDMGGTSTDVCLVTAGEPGLTSEFHLDGLPVRIPMLDINTVGAGGGSIIHIDEGGMLRVGPSSAGADPGPACYCRNGVEPTITDAQVLRGAIRKETFLGGRMDIDGARAAAALTPIAGELGQSAEAAADSAVRVANANIVRAIQLITTERGKDPRDFVIVAFGGAGPLHAAQVADELGVGRVLVPPNAGVVSAFGLLTSDFVLCESRTRVMPLNTKSLALVRETFDKMIERINERYAEIGFNQKADCEHTIDMRYVGQAFEVAVDLDNDSLADLDVASLRQKFADEHEKIFFHGADTSMAVEVVNMRIKATIALDNPKPLADADQTQEKPLEVRIFDDRSWHTGLQYTRATLKARGEAAGPVLVVDPTSTVFVPAGWVAVVDRTDNLIMRNTEK